jgi:hypothetical protein
MPATGFRMQAMAILWPAFLMAGVLEMLVFALVDPGNLHWFGGEQVTLSPSAVYTLAFFVFWGVIATAGALTQLLERPPEEVNQSAAPGSAPHWPR